LLVVLPPAAPAPPLPPAPAPPSDVPLLLVSSPPPPLGPHPYTMIPRKPTPNSAHNRMAPWLRAPVPHSGRAISSLPRGNEDCLAGCSHGSGARGDGIGAQGECSETSWS